jgi:uncharacterized repeat protein (TIGR01451 family)
LTLVCASLVLVAGAAVSRAQGAEACSTSGPLVCLTVSATPQDVSPSREGSPTYVSYDVVASNRATNTITHAALVATLPGGSSFVSATPDVGSCTSSAGLVSCQFGSLARGSIASVEIVVQAPSSEGEAVATFRVSFDEGFNDTGSPDPKQDTVTVSEAVGVAATRDSAASFVPQGASVELSTDPTGTGVATTSDQQVAAAAITSSPASVLALLEEVPGPLTCPKRVVCREGDWVQAIIPGTFDPPLAFELRWDATLIPSGLTAKKFAVLVTECLSGCPLEVVSDRCSSATPAKSELPCLRNVARLKDGDWVATLLNSHNGYMH